MVSSIKQLLPLVIIILLIIAGIAANKLFVLFILIGLAFASLYLLLNDLKIESRDLVLILIVASLLFPPIRLSKTIPDVRFEEVIIYILFPLLLVQLWPPETKYIRSLLIGMFTFCAFICVSIFYSHIFLNVPTGFRDYFEVIKIIKLGLILVIVYNLEIEKPSFMLFLHLLLACITISAIIGFLEYYSIFSFDKMVAPLFANTQLDAVNLRMLGTYGNPNSFGATLTIGCLTAGILFLFSRKILMRIYYLIALGILTWGLVLTGSRTAVVTLAATLFLLLLVNRKRLHLSWFAIITTVLFVLAIFVTALHFLSPKIVTRYQSGVNLTEDQSFLMRLLVWKYNLMAFLNSPVLGWGPAKYVMSTLVDNEYILMLRRYGVLGFIPYISIYLIPLLYSYKALSKSNALNIWGQLILIGTFVILLTNLTNTVLMDIQTTDYWFLLLGLFFNLYKKTELHAMNYSEEG